MLSPRHLEQAARAQREASRLRAVVRARIGAASAEDAHRARFALEDALDTADFGDCGRLIVVRTLSIGRMPAGAAGWTIARAVEQAWRRVASQAAPFTSPDAASAPVVFFPSATAARVAYIREVAHGRPTDAWFWPRALPEVAGAPSTADGVVRVLVAIADEGAGAVLADAVVRWEPQALTALGELLPAAAQESVRAALVPLAFAAAPGAGTIAGGPASGGAPMRDAGAAALRVVAVGAQALRACGRTQASAPDDWRSTWVSALVLRGVMGQPPTPVEVARATRAAARPRVRRDTPSEPPAGATAVHARDDVPRVADPPRAPLPDDAPVTGERTRHRPVTSGLPDVRPEARALPDTTTSREAQAAEPARARVRAPWLADAQPTQFAGLLMLLTVLEALGMERWTAAQAPAVAGLFTRAWLTDLADRLRVPDADGIRGAFALSADEARVFRQGTTAWAGFRWPRWLDAPLPGGQLPCARHALRPWRVAVRRALRIHGGIGLASLCRRTGLVAVTPTHVDMTLPLGAADLRVRRRGLDRDPGWVPWYGRIVAFHYADVFVPEAGEGDA